MKLVPVSYKHPLKLLTESVTCASQEEHGWKMTRTPIRSSFTRLKYSDNIEAVALFKLVSTRAVHVSCCHGDGGVVTDCGELVFVFVFLVI